MTETATVDLTLKDKGAINPDGRIAVGVYTVIGPRGHRTIKVQKIDAPEKPGINGKTAVYVMTGPDNLFNYTGVAFLRNEEVEVEEEYEEESTDDNGYVHFEKRKRTVKKQKDVLQIWVRQRGTELHKVVQAWYRIVTDGIPNYSYELAKHCYKCGRLLTNPDSIEAGIGPICAQGGIDS